MRPVHIELDLFQFLSSFLGHPVTHSSSILASAAAFLTYCLIQEEMSRQGGTGGGKTGMGMEGGGKDNNRQKEGMTNAQHGEQVSSPIHFCTFSLIKINSLNAILTGSGVSLFSGVMGWE